MESDLDLRLLRVFTTLARVGSFTRTAELMSVTQSAISHGMKRLEEQLGCPLIYKKGKTTHLTPEGRRFLGQVLRILDAVDRAAESVSTKGAASGKLSVIFTTSMAQSILAPVLREFRESYPDVSVIVKLQNSPQAVKEVEEGTADLALVVEDVLPVGLKAHPLFEDQLELLVSPLHRWADVKRLSTADLSKEHFLLYQQGSVTFRRMEDYFLQCGVRLQSYVEIPSFEVMKQLARLGLGVALMAPWVAADELADGSLVARPTPKSTVKRKWVVVHQGHRVLRETEQTFIGLCRMAAARVEGRGVGG